MEEWGTTSLRRIVSPIAAFMMILASFSLVAMNLVGDWYDGEPAVVTDKEAYQSGEDVRINVTCYIGSEFSSTGQCFFVVKDAFNNTVYDLRRHVAVGWMLTSLIPPKTFSFLWNQKTDSDHLASLGTYAVWGYEAGYNFWGPPIAGSSTSITILEDSSPVPTVERCDVNLLQGWNLFSLPLVAANYTSASLGLPTGSVVVRWNSTAGLYDSTFVVGVSPASNAFALVEGCAYWVYPSSYCTVSIYGATLNVTRNYDWNVPSQGGWVLASFPKASRLWHASEVCLLTDLPDAILSIVHWNPGFQKYDAYISGVITSDFYMIPGSGCWAYISESLTVAFVA